MTVIDTISYIPVITKRIIDSYNPDKIILFGSHATGTARPDSDLDFLVVLKEVNLATRRNFMVGMLKLMSDLPIAKDILVYSPDEMEQHKNKKWSVVYSAMQEGKVVYESK
jgi:predicted nucleotidyltransferase